ncbi:MAG: hypothetical protein OSB62_09050, partial [Alphaproteobacteria bacterium]|nr:hypothetical protein [Alphaproteobacteria bacterium]
YKHMLKILTILAALLFNLQSFASSSPTFILEIMWDDAVKGDVKINDESIWQFPLNKKEETALKNLPEMIKKKLSIHSFNAEQNLIRLYANDLFGDKVNTMTYRYKKHTKEYIRYRPSRLGYYLYNAVDPADKDTWILMDYKQQPIDNSGEMIVSLNPFNELVPFYVEGFTPINEEVPAAGDNVRAIYRELTVELMNGNFTGLETLNPANELRFSLFKNKTLLNNNQFACKRGERTEARIRFIDGAAFVTGNLASCAVLTKEGHKDSIQFDYFQYQYNGKDWVLADFLIRDPRQASVFPEDSASSKGVSLDSFSVDSEEPSSSN